MKNAALQTWLATQQQLSSGVLNRIWHYPHNQERDFLGAISLLGG
jgi:hypothetical protein